MGKKNRNKDELVSRKGKRGMRPFTFLGTQFDSVDVDTVKHHIIFLVIASIVTKFIVIFATTIVFNSFIDLFDIGTYLKHAMPLMQGQLPYINYQIEYPVLSFFPILLAFIPALLLQNVMVFVYSFQIFMALFDIIIVISIYLIGLKIWNEKTAFFAGLIYASAFATAYLVLTKSDAFPTCLLMGAVLFTIYGMNMRGYICTTLGFFSKVFPAIALPFIVLYNAKTTSLKEEIISVVKVIIPASLIFFVPLVLIRPEVANAYLVATGSTVGFFVNTATFTLFTYLHDIGHLGIALTTVSAFMYLVMGLVICSLIYLAYSEPQKKPILLLKIIFCAIFTTIYLSKFHSPQYIVWYTPLLCLLVSQDLPKILLFYLTQIFAYIEFPLMFGKFYTNLEYVNPQGSNGWYVTLAFFTLEYLTLIILLYFVLRPDTGVISMIKESIKNTFNENE